jgi:hypothetical protein
VIHRPLCRDVEINSTAARAFCCLLVQFPVPTATDMTEGRYSVDVHVQGKFIEPERLADGCRHTHVRLPLLRNHSGQCGGGSFWHARKLTSKTPYKIANKLKNQRVGAKNTIDTHTSVASALLQITESERGEVSGGRVFYWDMQHTQAHLCEYALLDDRRAAAPWVWRSMATHY